MRNLITEKELDLVFLVENCLKEDSVAVINEPPQIPTPNFSAFQAARQDQEGWWHCNSPLKPTFMRNDGPRLCTFL